MAGQNLLTYILQGLDTQRQNILFTLCTRKEGGFFFVVWFLEDSVFPEPGGV